MNKTEIAQNILDQLGNNQFLMMTDAKDLVVGGNNDWAGYLQFRVTGNRTVQVGLLNDDTYEIKVTKLNKKTFEFKTIANAKSVMVSQLRETFTNLTGLYCAI